MKLLKENLIEKVGKTVNQTIRLSKSYFSFVDKRGEYSVETPLEEYHVVMLINNHFNQFKIAKMGDFVSLLNKFMTRQQVRTIIEKLVNSGHLDRRGQGRGTEYLLGKKTQDGQRMIARVLEVGIEEMKKRGEIREEDSPA